MRTTRSSIAAHLAACDDATYVKARTIAEPMHEGGHDVMFRCALSFVFPDEDAWARKTLEESAYMVQGHGAGDLPLRARAIAEPMHEGGHDVMFRCALSFVFPDDADQIELAPREVLQLFSRAPLSPRLRTSRARSCATKRSPRVGDFSGG